MSNSTLTSEDGSRLELVSSVEAMELELCRTPCNSIGSVFSSAGDQPSTSKGVTMAPSCTSTLCASEQGSRLSMSSHQGSMSSLVLSVNGGDLGQQPKSEQVIAGCGDMAPPPPPPPPAFTPPNSREAMGSSNAKKDDQGQQSSRNEQLVPRQVKASPVRTCPKCGLKY